VEVDVRILEEEVGELKLFLKGSLLSLSLRPILGL
jgi:hypothetical protein